MTIKTDISVLDESTSFKKARKSGVELLKIVAILIICLAHSVETCNRYVDIYTPTTDASIFLMNLLLFGGQFGNDIFLVCSSFFLIKSKKTKTEKAVNILLDSQAISIIMFVLVTVFAATFSISLTTDNYFSYYMSQFFPDLYEKVWFVPAYVVLYLIHPALNLIIKSLSQKAHLCVCLLVVTVYGFFGYFVPQPVYSKLLAIVFIYFLTAYIYTYCNRFTDSLRKNILFTVFTLIAFLIVFTVNNYLGVKFGISIEYANLSRMLSIFNLSLAIGLLNCFRHIKLQSKFINYLSSLSLFFYCIHENQMVKRFMRPSCVEFSSDYLNDNYLLCALLLFVVLTVASVISAVIYKETVHKLTEKISVKIKYIVSNTLDRIVIFNNRHNR